jgi:hypothetical protein
MTCRANTLAQSPGAIDLLTQATIITQSSTARLLNIANLDIILAVTKTEARTKVVVVTTNTTWPFEWFPPKEAI